MADDDAYFKFVAARDAAIKKLNAERYSKLSESERLAADDNARRIQAGAFPKKQGILCNETVHTVQLAKTIAIGIKQLADISEQHDDLQTIEQSEVSIPESEKLLGMELEELERLLFERGQQQCISRHLYPANGVVLFETRPYWCYADVVLAIGNQIWQSMTTSYRQSLAMQWASIRNDLAFHVPDPSLLLERIEEELESIQAIAPSAGVVTGAVYSPWIDATQLLELMVDNGHHKKVSEKTIGRTKSTWGAEPQAGTNNQKFRFRLETLRSLGIRYPVKWDANG